MSLYLFILFNPHLRIHFLLIVFLIEGKGKKKEREGKRNIDVTEDIDLVASSMQQGIEPTT